LIRNNPSSTANSTKCSTTELKPPSRVPPTRQVDHDPSHGNLVPGH
jgi:hypothetical protein